MGDILKNHLTDKDLQQIGIDNAILEGLAKFDILPPITERHGGVYTMNRSDLRIVINRGLKLLLDTYEIVERSRKAVEAVRELGADEGLAERERLMAEIDELAKDAEVVE